MKLPDPITDEALARAHQYALFSCGHPDPAIAEDADIIGSLVARVHQAEALAAHLATALRKSHGHIVKHHTTFRARFPGSFCPVCHHEDGTEPELDAIAAALAAAKEYLP